MNKIFLSYSYNDKAHAALLLAQMSGQKDFQLFTTEGDIEPGEDVYDKIRSNLQKASSVLWLISKRGTIWQNKELEIASEMRLPILGILTSYIPREEIPSYKKFDIPIIEWSYDNLIQILKKDQNSINYEVEPTKLENKVIKVDLINVSDELTQLLLKNPEEIHNLSSRKYEEFIAFILDKLGYEVTLTQETRDNGVDIYALKKDKLGSFLTLIDCKKFSKDRKVGVGIVRNLYGTLQMEKASHAMIATTSFFTRDAKMLEDKYKYQISLKNHEDIMQWLKAIS